MSSLLVFTIGPVQSFIAQARKTQDLSAASFILSHLCRVAFTEACKRYGAEVIYPVMDNPSVPNRFVALLPSKSVEELRDIGISLEKTVRQEFTRIGMDVLEKTLPELVYTDRTAKLYREQLESFLEIYWAAGVCPEERYAQTYAQIESTLAAVKNTRVFLPLSEQGRKCSLTGEHNALFYRGQAKAHLCPGAYRVSDGFPRKYLGEGECLGGPAFLKRCADKYFDSADYKANFPNARYKASSTAEVALMESLKCLPLEQVEEYKKIFGSAFDYQLFYKENLTERAFTKEGLPLERLPIAQDALTALEETAARQKVKLTRYYAVLCMDGDDMGKWVGGAYLEDESELPAFQRNLTQKLGDYASLVRNTIVRWPRGCLVYCGGDDVLALLNLNHLVAVLEELRDSFPDFQKLARNGVRKESTTSCGVCIAHYKAPLAEALRWARGMERKAKDTDGKDSFAIALLKHSGEIRRAVFRWQYDELRPLRVLRRLTELLVRDEFSETFIWNLVREFRVLIPTGDVNTREGWSRPRLVRSGFSASEEEMLRAEVGRLLKRACKLEKKTNGDRIITTIAELQNQLSELYVQTSLENFLSFLEIAAFLAREVNGENAPED